MKNTIKYIVLILSCAIILGACNKNTAADSAGTVDSTITDDNAQGSMPIIYIDTEDKGTDNMDFVTKPVASHVSESIASWTPNYEMPPEPYYEDCVISIEENGQKIQLGDAQVKVRGNWTTSYDKKPLRIKLKDAQNLLGLNDGNAYKNWVLLAEYKDASMLRNKTALSISRELLENDGLYASDAELVEVYINGEYWGVYLLAEQQQINEGRIEITEASEGYTGTDIGYFLEFDGYYYTEDMLQSFEISYADCAPLIPYDGSDSTQSITYTGHRGITIKSDIYSEAQRDFIASYIDQVYKIMYYASYNDEAYVFNESYTAITKTDDITPKEAVERVVNVQSLVDVYILNELFCDADIYFSSFCMTVDFGPAGDKRLTFQAPWDYDSGLGNKNRCLDGTGFYAANGVPDVNSQPSPDGRDEQINPWLAVLIHEDWVQSAVRDTWTKAYDDGVFERALVMIDEDKISGQEAFDRNYDRWNNIINNSAFVNELSSKAAACKTQSEAANFLREWLQSRITFLNEKWHR